MRKDCYDLFKICDKDYEHKGRFDTLVLAERCRDSFIAGSEGSLCERDFYIVANKV